MNEQKAALRRDMLLQLGILTPTERQARSERLALALARLPALQAAAHVLLFSPLPTEPDVNLLWSAGLLAGKICAYPRVEEDRLVFYQVDDPEQLQPGRWSLREPVADLARRIEPAACDLILTPGLAFTASGKRLGRGGGYYDRALASAGPRARKIGVAFCFQLLPDLPADSHDISMDLVLTDLS